MLYFRCFLVAVLLAIIAYTSVTISHHGWNLLPIFFGDMMAMTWPGQFNFDFFTFLLLSGLWTAWRNEFRPAAIGLALGATFGGMLFLSAYLLYLSYRTSGNIAAVLLGPGRLQRLRGAMSPE
ncbi:hypothetical protein EAO27_18295 [Sphingopyxis sp. YF1]|nr:hypothetical protein EAO27_18295 [Sphingopyxis sp. YF1]